MNNINEIIRSAWEMYQQGVNANDLTSQDYRNLHVFERRYNAWSNETISQLSEQFEQCRRMVYGLLNDPDFVHTQPNGVTREEFADTCTEVFNFCSWNTKVETEFFSKK